MPEALELVVLTRRDCGLCEEMEAVVAPFAQGRDVSLERIDVDSDPALAATYGAEVPVLLVNGRKAFKYRVDERRLRARLRAERRRLLAGRLRGLLRSGAED